jgi:hypothetical protein
MTRSDPDDRPAAVFGRTVTLYAGADRRRTSYREGGAWPG